MWRRPCLNRDGTVGAERARGLSHKVEDMVMYRSQNSRLIIYTFGALLLLGWTMTINVFAETLNLYPAF